VCGVLDVLEGRDIQAAVRYSFWKLGVQKSSDTVDKSVHSRF